MRELLMSTFDDEPYPESELGAVFWSSSFNATPRPCIDSSSRRGTTAYVASSTSPTRSPARPS
ncbi:MAG: hypothetical protein R2710_12385 [Acidimicrobiales bacterium]